MTNFFENVISSRVYVSMYKNMEQIRRVNPYLYYTGYFRRIKQKLE